MRLFFVCLLTVCLLFCFTACTPAPRDSFAYAAEAFSATVRGTYTPVGDSTPRSFTARVTAGAPVGGDPTRRDLAVVFSSPPSLKGVTVTATLTPGPDGTDQRSVVFTYPSEYGNIEIPAKGEEFDGLLRFAEALLPVGDLAAISPVAEDGTHTVTRITADGTRSAVFRFSPEQALPLHVMVQEGDTTLDFTVTP